MAPKVDKREVWLLADSGQVVRNIHPVVQCSGVCVVHNPSAHHMRKLELGFDIQKRAFLRTCEHGAKHHDPDERTYWTNKLELYKSREKVGSKMVMMALNKLTSWPCPLCPCGCCDLTRKA